MSAICGIVQHNKDPMALQRCRTVQAALAPYGRHAQGLWDSQHVALGSRLTRLLPEDQYDHQPLHGGNGRFVLIADVRLDNRTELGHKLGISPARLQTMADADLLLAAYEQWEQQLVSHLLGDFAFAVWDKQQQSLFLARDHMGKRPLFYHQGHGWFGFATMPAGLLALPEVPMAPAQARLIDLLLHLPDITDHSYFAGINRLLPGHSAVLHADGTFHTRCYWAPPTEERIYFKSDADYVDAFVEKLEEAVRCRLRSTGSIASQLSAGFDSGTVTSVAARLLGQTGENLHAFTSVPYTEGLTHSYHRILDEGPLAAKVATLFPNIQHHRIRANETSILSLLETLFSLYNRPARNVINLLWDSTITQQAVAQGATTLLTGELGNLTISYHGGQVFNTLLREGRFIELLQQIQHTRHTNNNLSWQSILYKTLMPSLPYSLQFMLKNRRNHHKTTDEAGYFINPNIIKSNEFQQYCRQQGIYPNMAMQSESRTTRQQALQQIDFGEYSKGTLAQSGIDRRDPTSDIRLISYCQAIPVEQFNKNGINRWLLRRALQRYWPAEVIDSRVRGKQSGDSPYKIDKEQDELAREITLQHAQPLIGSILNTEALQQQLAQQTSTEITAKSLSQGFHLLRHIAAGHFLRLASPSHE